MAKRPTLSDITTGHGTTTKLNANFDAIEQAFDNTLSRDGSAPNAMEADLDMNSNQIINLPDATTNGEPITLRQYLAGATGTVNGFRKESQIATAGQTVFTANTVQWVPGVDNLVVFLDGVMQGSGNYSINTSTQITFSAGVPLNTRVDFLVMNIAGTIASTTTDAGLVTYQPAGTTNVTNVETKLRESVSVKDFGAVGDGVADDTAAIQAALNSGALVVYIPKGTYQHSGLTINANTSVYGDGAKASVLKYTETTGNSVTLDGAVISFIGVKVTASSYVNGAGIYGNVAENVSDCYINNYEVENFKQGIYIGYGVNVFIGSGRLIGPGKTVAGSAGLQLGNLSASPAVLVNVAQISGCYSSSYQTNFYIDGSVTEMHNCISESCINAINVNSRLTVTASWVQADTYLLTMRGSIPVTFTNSYFLDGSSVEVEDITSYCSLTGGATVDNIGVFRGSRFVGPGKLSLAFATSLTQGLRLGGATDQVVAYRDSDSLEIYATGRPLQVNRNQSGAVTLFGLKQQNATVGYIGIDASGNPSLYGSNGANVAAKWDTSSNFLSGAGVVSTSATDGFLYVPTCAGTPTGTPTAKTGYVPIIVDSTNNKMYFYSGGSWQDVGP